MSNFLDLLRAYLGICFFTIWGIYCNIINELPFIFTFEVIKKMLLPITLINIILVIIFIFYKNDVVDKNQKNERFINLNKHK